MLLRVAAHDDASRLKVWAIIRSQEPSVQAVILRDMIQEARFIRDEISRIYDRMTAEEKEEARKEALRLEKMLGREISVTLKIICAQCGTANAQNSAMCLSCGALLMPEVGVGVR